MQEPARITDTKELVPYVAARVNALLIAMEAHGFDPIIFETKRSIKRQRWLYGKGRTKWQCIKAGISPAYAQPKAQRVTRTLDSKHIAGKAADIISKSTLWSDPKFFVALGREAKKVRLHQLAEIQDYAHVEWRG